MKRRFVFLTILTLLLAKAVFAQKMTVKDDGGNVLMEVNDEGLQDSITLPSMGVEPVVKANKLYNFDGVLYWNLSDKMPDQTGHSSKYLTTNRTNASWSSLTIPEGHILDASDGSPVDALQVDEEGRVLVGTQASFFLFEANGAASNWSGAGRFKNTGMAEYGYGVFAECLSVTTSGWGGYFKGKYHCIYSMVTNDGLGLYSGLYTLVKGGSGTNYGLMSQVVDG
ncbi:MAG: hypothetical protein ABIL68_05525 [bacterium]